jgi:arylsulfatase A-like enzyme
MSDQQPNFLLFITDQQRADHLGCYGNPIVRTPAIDALARAGWCADEFYTATPICMPNRSSLMTGRMPSRHGVRHNGIELSLDETTFVEALRAAGYGTALVGKSHLQNIEVIPPSYPREGEPRRSHEARREGQGRHGQEIWKRWEDDPECEIETPFYGFEHLDLVIHHADTAYGHWRRWLRAQTREADQLIGPENAVPTPHLALTACRQAWRTRVPEELYPTHWIAERTIARARELSRREKPWFIQCSFPDPHHPFTPPGRYFDMVKPDDVPAPHSFHARHEGLAPHMRWLYEMRDTGRAVKHTQALFACTEREAREAIALNYGSIKCIDDAIARVMKEVNDNENGRDTVVIFTSDHGDFLGDHQILLKGPVHYRGLVRVPFIWADPDARKGARSKALTQTTDIAPTILRRAGIEPWNGIQGQSLLPLITGERGKQRERLLIEEEGQRYYMGFPERVRMRSVVTERYRLSLYDGVPWGELYDLREDPDELVNRWDDAGARGLRGSLADELARAMIEHAETSPYPTQIA